jgi:hypothetical protein
MPAIILADRLRSMSQTLQDAREPNKIIYLITDGQESQFAELMERETEPFDDVNLQVMKVGESETSNIGFESVELEYGGRRNRYSSAPNTGKNFRITNGIQ